VLVYIGILLAAKPSSKQAEPSGKQAETFCCQQNLSAY
jgi:hypothetical protein